MARLTRLACRVATVWRETSGWRRSRPVGRRMWARPNGSTERGNSAGETRKLHVHDDAGSLTVAAAAARRLCPRFVVATGRVHARRGPMATRSARPAVTATLMFGLRAPHTTTTNKSRIDAVRRRHRSPSQGPEPHHPDHPPDRRPPARRRPIWRPVPPTKLSSVAGLVTPAVQAPVTPSRPCRVERGVAPAPWPAGLDRCAT